MQIAWTQIDKKLDQTFYALELTVTATMITNIFQFVWWRCRERPGELTHWQRWDAAYILAAAVPLNLAFPLAVVLIYIGEVNYPASKMWRSSWFPNTPHGALLYIGKWCGVALMIAGVLKSTQLHRKVIRKWRQLRGQKTAPSASTAAATTVPNTATTAEP
mmetsp:Transcript_106511/g.318320  ORF Transcript_106511/g.318320 Transcript_106511/m.318320 type:complete len:161 (+) Transcript_106511:303-785(+)